MTKASHNFYYILTAIAAVIYVTLAFLTPSDPAALAKYNWTPAFIVWLRITLMLPILFTWFAATYAFSTLGNYITLIKGSWEESAFKKLWIGIGIIFWSSVFSSLVSTFGNYLRQGISTQPHPLRPLFTIIQNYFAIFPMLIGFIFILMAGMIFLKNCGRKISIQWKIVTGIILAVIAYVLLDLIFTNTVRTVPNASGVSTYFLNDALIVVTIILPLFAAWIIGLFATKCFSLYTRFTEGILYKQLFSNVMLGLNSLIFLSMFLQTFSAIGAERLADLGAESILLLIYFIIAVYGLAYLFIARGVRKLSQIEAV